MKLEILIIIKLVSSILSLKSSDLCYIIEKECKGKYDHNFNYEINCESIKCQGEYSYECDNKCTKDKTTCFQYKEFRLVNQRFRGDLFSIFNYLNNNDRESGKTKINNFDQNIQACPDRKYEFKLNHICLSGNHCYEKIKLYSGSKHEKVHKMNCFCQGIYNYECNGSFCSINKKSCDSFTKLSNAKNNTKRVLNRCSNDFVIKIKQSIAYSSRIKII